MTVLPSTLVRIRVGLHNQATENRDMDHLIAASFYWQMLYQVHHCSLGDSGWHMQFDDVRQRSVIELTQR